MNNSTDNNSHRVFVSNGNICLEHNELVIITIPIDELKLIGEYTNDLGPFQPDWYLNFYYGDSEYFEFSMDTNQIMDMLSDLGKILKAEILPSLFDSADWKSQILFPNKYKGNPIWIRKMVESNGILHFLKSLIGSQKYELVMTNIAKEIIENKSR